MERKNAWEKYSEQDREKVFEFAENYRQFISCCKTERECVREFLKLAKEAGFVDIEDVIKEKKALKPGDRVIAVNQMKGIAMFIVGEKGIEEGMNILGAHIDSPRLDLKQNPLYEDTQMALSTTPPPISTSFISAF